jgi:Tfp pilus assembly protein PilO
MKRLSKQKRNQLVMVVLVTVLVVAGLWITLIRYQQSALRTLYAKRKTDQTKLFQIQETIRNSKQIEADLVVVSNRLAAQEQDMASGDLYASMYTMIKNFKTPYAVDIPQFTSGGMAELNLLPKFPYKQYTISISGTAHFYDLGRFVADFENQYPSSRIVNLELVPASATGPEDKERLSFKMDIVSLVQPGVPRPSTSR